MKIHLYFCSLKTSVIPLLLCVFALFIAGCLESDERPILNPNDLALMPGVEGVYESKSTDGTSRYYLVERFRGLPKQYFVMSWKWPKRKSFNDIEPLWSYDLGLLHIGKTSDGEDLFLGVLDRLDSDEQRTRFIEINVRNDQWSYGILDWHAYHNLNSLTQTTAKAGLSVLVKAYPTDPSIRYPTYLKGGLSSGKLLALFTDPDFRQFLKVKSREEMRRLSPDEKRLLPIPDSSWRMNEELAKGNPRLEASLAAMSKSMRSCIKDLQTPFECREGMAKAIIEDSKCSPVETQEGLKCRQTSWGLAATAFKRATGKWAFYMKGNQQQ